MTGLDKIINQILDEANNSANEKLEEAKAKAKEIMDKAEAEAKAIEEEISKKSEVEVANYKDRVESSADLKRRTAILEAKQEVIAQTMEKAYEKFCSKSDGEYFSTLKEMLKIFALPQDGEIYFSGGDLKKMPSGFEEEIGKIAKEKGGSLTVSKESKEVEGGGFVLAYGGVEENCSFRALFDSRKDDLQDQIQKVLFA